MKPKPFQKGFDFLRIFLANAAKKGAAIKPQGAMCNDCAFKLNTDANNDSKAVQAAFHCLMGQGVFHCHEQYQKPGSKKTVLVAAGFECAGYLYAKQHLEQENLQKSE